eukprot:6173538-Pleurochrysis_carterae.AAC.1
MCRIALAVPPALAPPPALKLPGLRQRATPKRDSLRVYATAGAPPIAELSASRCAAATTCSLRSVTPIALRAAALSSRFTFARTRCDARTLARFRVSPFSFCLLPRAPVLRVSARLACTSAPNSLFAAVTAIQSYLASTGTRPCLAESLNTHASAGEVFFTCPATWPALRAVVDAVSATLRRTKAGRAAAPSLFHCASHSARGRVKHLVQACTTPGEPRLFLSTADLWLNCPVARPGYSPHTHACFRSASFSVRHTLPTLPFVVRAPAQPASTRKFNPSFDVSVGSSRSPSLRQCDTPLTLSLLAYSHAHKWYATIALAHHAFV